MPVANYHLTGRSKLLREQAQKQFVFTSGAALNGPFAAFAEEYSNSYEGIPKSTAGWIVPQTCRTKAWALKYRSSLLANLENQPVIFKPELLSN